MAVPIATACKVYVGQYDISGDLCKIAVENGAAELDGRVFGNTAGKAVLGMYESKITGQGYVTFGTTSVHAALRANFGVVDVPVTVSPETGAAGDVAVFLKAIQATYTLGEKVGEILPFSVAAHARGIPAIAGRIFVAAGNKTATSVSSIINIGAVSATQTVYAALHVLSVSGTNPTLDVTVKSDALVGFGSPATQLTFTQAVAAGYQWQSLAGANTDVEWRVDFTIGGTATPTFSFVVAVGIF